MKVGNDSLSVIHTTRGPAAGSPTVLESEQFPCPVADSNWQQENSAPQFSSSECSPGHFPVVGREIKVLTTRFPRIQYLLAAGPRVQNSGGGSMTGPCPAIAPSLIPVPRQPQSPAIHSPLFSSPYFPHLHPAHLVSHLPGPPTHSSQSSQFQPTGARVYSGRITSGLSSRRFWIG